MFPEVNSRSARECLILPMNPHYQWWLVACLFVAAIAVRMVYIDTIDFTPMRQHRSAIIARAYYYEGNASIPEWKREVSAIQMKQQGILEPPIMEWLAASAYRIAGGEHLFIPRALSAMWWVVGGMVLFLLARRLLSVDEAMIATAFYLLLPFGVLASRSFQPDPLMVMWLLLGLFSLGRYYQARSLPRLLLAAGASSVAVLVKPQCLFLLLGGTIGLSAVTMGVRNMMRDWGGAAYLLLSLVPCGLYYGIRYVSNPSMAENSLAWVDVDLWLTPTFWAGWLAQIHLVVGFPAFAAALVGAAWFHRGAGKALLAGLWGGYAVFGLAFPYHISTHDYYQLPLIPVVGLSLAPLLLVLWEQVGLAIENRAVKAGIVLSCMLLAIAADGIKIVENNFDRHARWQKNERLIAPEIGRLVNHSTKTVFLSISGGLPLQYYGELGGHEYWHRNEAISKFIKEAGRGNPAERLTEAYLGFQPEYFIVTEILEYKKQPELQEFLSQHHPVLAQSTDYVIFDLRSNIDGRGMP